MAVLFIVTIGPGSSVAATSSPPVTQIDSIRIHSFWEGMPNQTMEYNAEIDRRGDEFFSDGKIVPVSKIEALLAAATAPSMPAPTAQAFMGIGPLPAPTASDLFDFWINHDGGERDGFFTQQQKDFFIATIRNPAIVTDGLLAYYADKNHLYDDEPSVSVDIRLADGKTIAIQSDSQKILMLPWSVGIDKSVGTTFSPALSIAIAALMPSSAVNADRLSGMTLPDALASIAASQVQKEFDKLPRYNRNAVVSALEAKYNVHIEWENQTNARLTWTDLPRGFEAVVRLPIVNNSFENVQAIAAARGYTERAASIPWLKHFVAEKPGVKAEILLEATSPLSYDGVDKERFTADMSVMGRQDIVSKVESSQTGAFFVLLDEPGNFSMWVALPNQTMILWSYYSGEKSIAGRDPASLHSSPCKDSDLCTVVEVLPDGTSPKGHL